MISGNMISLEQVWQFDSAPSNAPLVMTLDPPEERELNTTLMEAVKNNSEGNTELLAALYKAYFVYKNMLEYINERQAHLEGLSNDIGGQKVEIDTLQQRVQGLDSQRSTTLKVAQAIRSVTWPVIVLAPYLVAGPAAVITTTLSVACRWIAEATATVLASPPSSSTSSPSGQPSTDLRSSQEVPSSYIQLKWYQDLDGYAKNNPDTKISSYIRQVLFAIVANDTTIVRKLEGSISETEAIKQMNATQIENVKSELDSKGLLSLAMGVGGELGRNVPTLKRKDPPPESPDDQL